MTQLPTPEEIAKELAHFWGWRPGATHMVAQAIRTERERFKMPSEREALEFIGTGPGTGKALETYRWLRTRLGGSHE